MQAICFVTLSLPAHLLVVLNLFATFYFILFIYLFIYLFFFGGGGVGGRSEARNVSPCLWGFTSVFDELRLI